MGTYAINPVNNKEIPIWISDYVIMSYGTGAIMAVPGEDERDWDFAKKYNLPVVRTIDPGENFDGGAYTGEGLLINSDFLNGLDISTAKEKMAKWLIDNEKGRRLYNTSYATGFFHGKDIGENQFQLYIKMVNQIY